MTVTGKIDQRVLELRTVGDAVYHARSGLTDKSLRSKSNRKKLQKTYGDAIIELSEREARRQFHDHARAMSAMGVTDLNSLYASRPGTAASIKSAPGVNSHQFQDRLQQPSSRPGSSFRPQRPSSSMQRPTTAYAPSGRAFSSKGRRADFNMHPRYDALRRQHSFDTGINGDTRALPNPYNLEESSLHNLDKLDQLLNDLRNSNDERNDTIVSAIRQMEYDLPMPDTSNWEDPEAAMREEENYLARQQVLEQQGVKTHQGMSNMHWKDGAYILTCMHAHKPFFFFFFHFL
jgi:hypothetical protein